MNPKVDRYLRKAKNWQREMGELRKILLQCPVTEELKWGKPCYTVNGANVVLVIGFKRYCALLFCKGALLKDPKRILITPTENTQAARQIRFTNVPDIQKMAPVLRAYVQEAVAAEKAGLDINYKRTSQFKVPAEFREKLAETPALKSAFRALTPGRQRAYLLYFSGAKQSKTRAARIEKCLPQILIGKGLHDE